MKKEITSKLFEKKEIEFILNNYKGIDNRQLTNLLNNRFDKNYDWMQVKNFKKRNRLDSGLTGQFEKEHVPFNKGRKASEYLTIEQYDKQMKQFNKDRRKVSYNLKPLGSTRRHRDGYWEIKVCNKNGKKSWISLHKYLYEREHGKIPAKHKVIFLDKDKENLNLSNLACVSYDEALKLNQKHLLFENAELSKSGIAIIKLERAMAKKKKGEKDEWYKWNWNNI